MSHWAIAFRRSSWLAAMFSIMILVALSWNAFSSRAVDPNPPTKVDDLVTRINLDPNNTQLVAQLRKQDEWLRSSYFRSIRFAQNGFILLVIGVGAFLILAKGADKLVATPIRPDPSAPSRNAADAFVSQRVVLTLGVSLCGVLALVATISRHDTVASYVQGQPLPQVSPVAPASPQGLPIAGAPLTAIVAPGTAGPSLSQSAEIAASVTSSGPIPLGGTALSPLPITSAGPSTAPTTPSKLSGGAKPTSKVELIRTADWPCFRGPQIGATGSWNGPADWDVVSGKGLLWKADLPLPGWNSPIIDAGRLYLSSADDKHREICSFDLATGKSLWRMSIPVLAGTLPVKPSPDAGYAPSTMATDGKRVFAAFVDGNIVCVSTEGKPVWGRAFGPLDNSYGFASSLLVAGGRLIVQMDQGSTPEEGKSRLYGLDPATGNTIWETKRAVSASWSSPVEVLLNGKAIVVAVASPGIAAFDAANGVELWHADGLSGEIAASSTCGDGRFYIGQQGSYLMAVSAADGKVDWTTSDPALPDIGSLAFGAGLVFLTTSDGTASAVDAATGKIVWEKRLDKPARASPIVVGDCVYLLGMDGVLRVFRAARTFSMVGQHRLGEPAEATPAFADGRMILRGDHHLFCIGAK